MTKRWQLGTAILLIVGFGVFVEFMVETGARSSDVTWTRLVYVFGSVEALVFSATGWLFGSEVNRRRAEVAEGRASEADLRADNAAREAADAAGARQVAEALGTALADAIRGANASNFGDSEAQLAGDGLSSASISDSTLVSLANAWFPAARDSDSRSTAAG